MRYFAQVWGVLLSPDARAPLVTSLIGHITAALLSSILLLWVRRADGVNPMLPKLFLAAMPVLLFASVDGLLKVTFRPPAIHPQVYMPHATRDWTFRPGSTGTFLGEPMRINSHGLPGPEVSYTKGDAEHRILFLGDSVAAGFGVREDECFVWRLGKLLRASDRYSHATVVNCSVISYSPWQQIDLLETEGLRYDPDVIVDVFCLNDYVEKLSLVRYGGCFSGPCEFVSPLLSRSGVYRALRTLFLPDRRLSDELGNDLLARYSVNRLIDDPNAAQFKNAWSITFANMDQMVGIARERVIPFVIVCFPYRVQLTGDAVAEPVPQARLARFARERAVPYLDLLPAFRAYAREHGPDGDGLFLDECHPTALGHAIAARCIYAFLQERGLLPPRSVAAMPGRP
ncbi:MAG: SGNH/GDSL hydrolase family protein [Phycisphaerae bacterium]